MRDGTWEALRVLHMETRAVLKIQVFRAQVLQNELKGGGVSRSSDESG
jgi:hypothetical protein